MYRQDYGNNRRGYNSGNRMRGGRGSRGRVMNGQRDPYSRGVAASSSSASSAAEPEDAAAAADVSSGGVVTVTLTEDEVKRAPTDSLGAGGEGLTEKFVWVLTSLVGRCVSVRTRDGRTHEGVLHTAVRSGKGGVDVVLAGVLPDDDDDDDGKVGRDFMAIDANDFVSMNVVGVPVEQSVPVAFPVVPVLFMTDTEMSSGKVNDEEEEELQRWTMDEKDEKNMSKKTRDIVNMSLDSADADEWDQFQVNEKHFGVKSDFSAEYYSPSVDETTDEYKKAKIRAQEIRDFESANSRAFNEERVESDASAIPSSSSGKYIPPYRRKKMQAAKTAEPPPQQQQRKKEPEDQPKKEEKKEPEKMPEQPQKQPEPEVKPVKQPEPEKVEETEKFEKDEKQVAEQPKKEEKPAAEQPKTEEKPAAPVFNMGATEFKMSASTFKPATESTTTTTAAATGTQVPPSGRRTQPFVPQSPNNVGRGGGVSRRGRGGYQFYGGGGFMPPMGYPMGPMPYVQQPMFIPSMGGGLNPMNPLWIPPDANQFQQPQRQQQWGPK